MARVAHIRCYTILALSLVTGCIQTQSPYSFTTPERPEPLLTAIVRAVEVQAGPVAETVPQFGLVRTHWENTGYCFINPHAHPNAPPGSTLRRFTVVAAPIASGGSTITVRADLKCCDNPVKVSSDGRSIRGRCVTPDGVYEKNQQEVDAIGAALRQALVHSNY